MIKKTKHNIIISNVNMYPMLWYILLTCVTFNFFNKKIINVTIPYGPNNSINPLSNSK